MEAYFHGYTDPIAQALGPLFGKSLRYFLIDSWNFMDMHLQPGH